MPGHFSVVDNALLDAAEGVTAVVNQIAQCDVSDIDPNEDHVGDSGLFHALSDFTERWEIGLRQLVGDGQQTAKRLRDTASIYLRCDEDVPANLRRVVGR